MNIEFFKYHLLNSKNEFVKELTNIDSCTVTYNSNTRLKQSASISITLNHNDIFNINDRIRVIHHLNGIDTVIGTFLISTPTQVYDTSCKSISLVCYSTLWLLDANKTTKRFVVHKGTNVVNEIIRLLDIYGIDVKIEKSLKSTSVDREWEIGTSILDICNDLLQSINYTSMYVNANGAFISKPYELPQMRRVDFEYNEQIKNNTVEQYIESELDLFDVPNVFVKYVNDPTVELVAVYENINPQSPTSTVHRPKNVSVEEVTDAADMQTLFDMCKRDASNVANKYHKIKFNTAINPLHSYLNTLYVNINTVRGRFTETSWEIDCSTGGVMKHEAREVVIV